MVCEILYCSNSVNFAYFIYFVHLYLIPHLVILASFWIHRIYIYLCMCFPCTLLACSSHSPWLSPASCYFLCKYFCWHSLQMLDLCCSQNVRHQFLHPYRTIGRCMDFFLSRRRSRTVNGFHFILTLRWLISYIYGAPILDVSRSHTTTQHSR